MARGILYSVIARGGVVLVKYASCGGNFSEVTEQLLGQIALEGGDSRLTYSHHSYLFHYVKEDGLTYLAITEDDFERGRAFQFLSEIKRRFEGSYGRGRILEALPYGMNSDFSPLLASEMKRFSESRDLDAITKVEGQLEDLKDIMVKNIDNMSSRGERLELLVNKAENLNATSVSFQKTSTSLARRMYWRNVKFYVLALIITLVVIYGIVSLSCGGLTWSGCTSPSSPTPAPAPTPAPNGTH